MESDKWHEKTISKDLKSSEKQGITFFPEAIGEGFFVRQYQAIQSGFLCTGWILTGKDAKRRWEGIPYKRRDVNKAE